MLYVFHVDAGVMMTFDMSLAFESVDNLKQSIENRCKIPTDKQVLLVSGGDCLDPNNRVNLYSAGTDTNPIYLFSKSVIESKTPPTSTIEFSSISGKDLIGKAAELNQLPAKLETVFQRTQLAQQFLESAKEQEKICNGLVHDQHLQQQGWAAVVANLEDITAVFKKRVEMFENNFSNFSSERQTYINFLQHFDKDLQILAKIPVLPQLLNDDADEKKLDEAEELSTVCDNSNKDEKTITLLEWISASDNKSSMDQLFEHCSKGLEQFNDDIFNSLHHEVESIIQFSENTDMKEVKGLGDRLYKLDQLMRDVKQIVQAQADLAQSFLKNQARASTLKDNSILPDLCLSHQTQLHSMVENQKQLFTIRKRFVNAKEELSLTLYHRLRWVTHVQSVMLEIDQKLVVYHDNLTRLRRNLEVLQQIHLAPTTYINAVTEVVRRREFSQTFLTWSSELACHLLTIHNEEMARRKDFQSQFDGHFLNSLFPGMSDLPPAYATQAPSIFDSDLPKLTLEDVEYLKKHLPDLSENLVVPDISAITNFFLMKSFAKTETDKVDDRGIEEKLVQVVTEVGLASNLDQNLLKPADSETCLAPHVIPLLKELDKGCESETDTEEFEKVGQSPLELHESASRVKTTQEAATLTEVGEKCFLPPKKPPRVFHKTHQNSQSTETCSSASHSSNMGYSLVSVPYNNPNNNCNLQLQRTLSSSGSHSNTESFTNVRNPSLESIDELASFKNFNSNTESCFNSHHHQSLAACVNTKSIISPTRIISPTKNEQNSPVSPQKNGGYHVHEFVNDEYYIDESLPSSISIETAGQGEFVRQLDNANNVVALLQDNLETSRSEQDKLKSTLFKMSDLASQTLSQLRTETTQFKNCFLDENKQIEAQYNSLTNLFKVLLEKRDIQEKESLEKLSVKHNLIIDEHKKSIDSCTNEIKQLRAQISELESNILEANEKQTLAYKQLEQYKEEKEKELQELILEMENLKLEKERNIKEVTEKLHRAHKDEIENIRSRFKLMSIAKMERSPTDFPESPDHEFKDPPSHETLILQIKHNYELEKEKAVKEAISEASQTWKNVLDNKITELTNQFEEDKKISIEEAVKRILEEKDRTIDSLRERQANLNLECIKYKNTIQQLAESETENSNVEHLEKIENLKKEKEMLEMALNQEKTRKIDEEFHEMTSSVSTTEVKVDVATSPMSEKVSLKSQSLQINVESILIGDVVLVLWDEDYNSYIIVQESPVMHFLHSNYVSKLGLLPKEGEKRKKYCLGVVIEKQHCQAKKPDNRYKVPLGTKFYRVKVIPRSKTQMTTMSQSQIVQRSFPRPEVQRSSSTLCNSLPFSSANMETSPGDISEKSVEDYSKPSTSTDNDEDISSEKKEIEKEGQAVVSR